MAKSIGLGLQVIDPTDLIRDGDDVISGNAEAVKAAIEEDRARLAVMEVAAGFENTVQLTDEMVSPLIGNEATSTGAQLVALIAKLTRRVSTLSDLQAACSQGGIIIVGDTPIALTSTVPVTARSHIFGGVFTLPVNASGLGFHITESDSSIDRAKFTGGGLASGYNQLRRFVHAEGTAASPLKGIRVRHCTMNGCQSENVRLTWCRDSAVFDNTMEDFLYAGVMLISPDSIDVQANKIRNGPLSDGVVNTYGVAATDADNTVAARARRVRVIGNTIEDVEWEAIDTHGGDAVTVIGNHIRNCSRGIALVVGNDTRVAVPTNCVVQGNLIELGTAVEREAISLFGNAATGLKADALITGNTIRGYSAGKAIYTTEYDPLKTLVEGNSHPHIPWTDLAMTNAAQWSANGSFPPQYMVEGRHVYLRGFTIPAGGIPSDSTVTRLPEICKTDRSLVFVGAAHGSNAAAGFATVAVNDLAELRMLYRTTTDTYSYPVESSYIRAFG